MRILRLRDAKASFSAVIAAAQRGEVTTITKHGRPAAVVVPIADAERLFGARQPSFAELLLSIPYPIETDRDNSPLRDPDL